MGIVYAIVAFLAACSGLMLTPSARFAELCAVAMFASGMSVLVLIAFAADV